MFYLYFKQNSEKELFTVAKSRSMDIQSAALQSVFSLFNISKKHFYWTDLESHKMLNDNFFLFAFPTMSSPCNKKHDFLFFMFLVTIWVVILERGNKCIVHSTALTDKQVLYNWTFFQGSFVQFSFSFRLNTCVPFSLYIYIVLYRILLLKSSSLCCF